MFENKFAQPNNYDQGRVENQEQREFRMKMAEELRKPEGGSFRKKLLRMATAAILSLPIGWEAKEAIAPVISKELKAYEMVTAAEGRSERLKKALGEKGIEELRETVKKAISKHGGFSVSDQVPEQILRPVELAKSVSDYALNQAGEGKTPYFMIPENILGEEFIRKNPEQAKEYFKKIEKAIKATVYITNFREEKGRIEKSIGSGAIVKNENGTFIITNEHVVEGSSNAVVEFYNGDMASVSVLAKDKNLDLAIIKMKNLIDQKSKERNSKELSFNEYLQKIKVAPLEIGSSTSLNQREKLAHVGNPYGFPFEVSVSSAEGIISPGEMVVDKNTGRKNSAYLLAALSDKRFEKLARYQEEKWGMFGKKGETMPGMSGGPIISLDQKGEPKLVGLNVQRSEPDYKKSKLTRAEYSDGIIINVGIVGEEVADFIDGLNKNRKKK